MNSSLTTRFDKVIVSAAIIYLLLPNLLFLLGWIRPLYSIPLCICITLACLSTIKQSTPFCHQYPIRKTAYTKKDFRVLIIAGIALLLFVDLIGLHGHVEQTIDFIARNAFYSSLINDGWPLFSERGEYFIYYHAFWLPPAFLSKIISPHISPETILYCWTYTGLSLFILLLFTRIRAKVLLFCGMFLLMGSLIENLNLPYTISLNLEKTNPDAHAYVNFFHYLGFGTKMRYFHPWGNVFYLLNHAVPALVCLALLFSKLIPIRFYLIPGALLVMCSPFAALALLPWLAGIYYSKPNEIMNVLKNPAFWLSTIFVLFIAPYFLGQSNETSTGGEMRLLWQFSTAYNQLPEPFHSPWVRVGRYFLILSGALIPAFILIKRRLRQTLYFKVYVFIAITIPLIWIGFHNNELLFKASLNMFFILTILIFSQWKVSGKARRVAIMIFLCLTCMHIYTDTNRRHLYKYSWNPEVTKKNIRNEWGGHLNHPEDNWYKHFWGKVLFPSVYYDAPAQSPIPPAQNQE